MVGFIQQSTGWGSRQRLIAATAAVFTVGGLAWLALKLSRSRRQRIEDDAMFAAPLQHDGGVPHSNGHLSSQLDAPLATSTAFVADGIRKEAMLSVKEAIKKLGGSVEESKKSRGESSSDSDESYETDLELELNIGNEMEHILRAQIVELSAQVFSADGQLLPGAHDPSDNNTTKRGKKSATRKTKAKGKKTPYLELLELTYQYLELSQERLLVQRKFEAQQASMPVALRGAIGKAARPDATAIFGAAGKRNVGPAYGDYYEEGDEDAAMDWTGGRHPFHDDDDDDDIPWKLHGPDDDDEDNWEDDDEEDYDEEEDEEDMWGDEEYDEEDTDDGFEAAWRRANGQPVPVGSVEDEMERAAFEQFLIERCMAQTIPDASTATGSDAEWESEEDDEGAPKVVESVMPRGGKKPSKNEGKQRVKRRDGGLSQQERYEQGEWVDF